jgi:hypothetical protein
VSSIFATLGGSGNRGGHVGKVVIDMSMSLETGLGQTDGVTHLDYRVVR